MIWSNFWQKRCNRFWIVVLLQLCFLPGSFAGTLTVSLKSEIRNFEKAVQQDAFSKARLHLNKIRLNFETFSRVELCESLIQAESRLFLFEEIYRLVFEEICTLRDIEPLAKGIVFLSLTRKKTILDIYIQWFNDFPLEKKRIKAFVSILPKARLGVSQYVSMINAFQDANLKRQAYLSFVSHFPFPKFMAGYLKFRKENPALGDRPEDKLIKNTYRLIRGRKLESSQIQILWRQCQGETSSGEFVTFWQVACGFHAKKRDLKLEPEVDIFFASHRMATIFTVIDNLQKYPEALISRLMK